MSWMPRESWDALVRGEGCPLCAALTSTDAADEHGLFVADLKSGRLRLQRNQLVKGYCILISRTHVREPYELTEDERRQFFDDMSSVGAALERLLQADKMNFQVLGNAVPHLHAHIQPRYHGDLAPNRALQSSDGELRLPDGAYAELVQQIRDSLRL